MNQSLRLQTTKSIFWVSVERLGQQLLQLIIFIFLARILSPNDFGLIAMLSVFLSLAQTFIDGGLGQALIRKIEITNEDRSTVFWFNLILAIFFYLILFFSAKYIADFYKQEKLIFLLRVLGLKVIFSSLFIIQRSEMTQKLNFKHQTFTILPSVLLGGIVSIIFAYNGFGVWSLVINSMIVEIVSGTLLWYSNPVKILFIFNKKSFNELFGFGSKLLISGLITTVYENVYKIIIGKFYEVKILGYFSQAQQITSLASTNLVGIISKVTYPMLAKIQDDPIRLKNGTKDILKLSTIIIAPIMTLLFIFANPFLQIVLGKEWVNATFYIQILCFSGVVYHIHDLNLNILKILGKSNLFLKLEFVKKISFTIIIAISFNYGINGLLIGSVILSFIGLYTNSYYTSKNIDYNIVEQMIDFLTAFSRIIPMLIFSLLLSYYINISNITELIFIILSSLTVYAATFYFYKDKLHYLIKEIIKSIN